MFGFKSKVRDYDRSYTPHVFESDEGDAAPLRKGSVAANFTGRDDTAFASEKLTPRASFTGTADDAPPPRVAKNIVHFEGSNAPLGPTPSRLPFVPITQDVPKRRPRRSVPMQVMTVPMQQRTIVQDEDDSSSFVSAIVTAEMVSSIMDSGSSYSAPDTTPSFEPGGSVNGFGGGGSSASYVDTSPSPSYDSTSSSSSDSSPSSNDW